MSVSCCRSGLCDLRAAVRERMSARAVFRLETPVRILALEEIMARLPILVVLATLFWGAAAVQAAPAPLPDLFTVSGVKIDASAESAIAARDLAMREGRTSAWTRLFRRFTATANWGKQPQLDDNALLRLVRSFEVA